MKRLIALTVIVCIVCSFAHAGSKEWQNIPGQRIGQITIGMEHAEVLRVLGAPHREEDDRSLAD